MKINEKDNLAIWDVVCRTNPDYAYPYKGPGGFTGTAISPTYLIREATKLWGPVGIAWGYEILEERFDSGAPIIDKETKVPTGACFQTHTLKLELWYPFKDQIGKLVGYGQTPFVYEDRYGIRTDYEAPKKSLTDALKKCLYVLGFSADIMLKEFDDPEYQKAIQEEIRIEKAEDKLKEQEAVQRERKEWFDKHCNLLSTATSQEELKTLYTGIVRTLKIYKEEHHIRKVEQLKDQRKSELEKKNEN